MATKKTMAGGCKKSCGTAKKTDTKAVAAKAAAPKSTKAKPAAKKTTKKATKK